MVRHEYLLILFINGNENKNKDLIPGHKLSYSYWDKHWITSEAGSKTNLDNGLAHCGNGSSYIIQIKWQNGSLVASLHCAVFKESIQRKKDIRTKGTTEESMETLYTWIIPGLIVQSMYTSWVIFFLSLSCSLRAKSRTWKNEKERAPLITFCHLLTMKKVNYNDV